MYYREATKRSTRATILIKASVDEREIELLERNKLTRCWRIFRQFYYNFSQLGGFESVNRERQPIDDLWKQTLKT